MTRYPDDDYTDTICKKGQGGCCRYLAMYPSGWSCEKHTVLGRQIDGLVATGEVKAKGDNCDGLDSRERENANGN